MQETQPRVRIAELRLGNRSKHMLVDGVTTVQEGVGLVKDTVITARMTVKTICLNMEELYLEQIGAVEMKRMDIAKELISAGMNEATVEAKLASNL